MFCSEAKRNFYCIDCDYSTTRKYDYKKHLATDKHKKQCAEVKKAKTFTCKDCGKIYKHQQSLSRHRVAICSGRRRSNTIINNITNNTINNITNNNNSNNTNNNNFNLNVFLNEDCKDAINMSEFIKAIKVQVDDLEHTKQNGICLGIKNIFMNALKNCEETKRPIHCTDVKRETLYIKENNEWERSKDNHEKMSKSFSDIADKQRKEIKEWEKVHIKSEVDKGKDDYQNLLSSTYSSLDKKEENSIIKSIAKEVKISQ